MQYSKYKTNTISIRQQQNLFWRCFVHWIRTNEKPNSRSSKAKSSFTWLLQKGPKATKRLKIPHTFLSIKLSLPSRPSRLVKSDNYCCLGKVPYGIRRYSTMYYGTVQLHTSGQYNKRPDLWYLCKDNINRHSNHVRCIFNGHIWWYVITTVSLVMPAAKE